MATWTILSDEKSLRADNHLWLIRAAVVRAKPSEQFVFVEQQFAF
jgi:hypothetical protein